MRMQIHWWTNWNLVVVMDVETQRQTKMDEKLVLRKKHWKMDEQNLAEKYWLN
jgi:hypothetical protein